MAPIAPRSAQFLTTKLLTPVTKHSEYKASLRKLTDEQLAAEKQRLTALKADASTGPVTDADAVKRADAMLGEIAEEDAARKAIAANRDPAYARSLHSKTNEQLKAEQLKQQERLNEATTGADRDPVRAAEAQAKLESIKSELAPRFRDVVQDMFQGPLPTDPATLKDGVFNRAFYGVKVGAMGDSDLAAERGRLEAEVKDASEGAHQDPMKAANARGKLEVVDAELARRAQTVAGYDATLRGMSDKQLASEKAKTQAVLKDASTGRHRDPAAVKRAQAELNEIAKEEKIRVENKTAKDPEYAATAHRMDDQALSTETRKQQERLREATTGLDQNPAQAADASAKLEQLSHESMRRAMTQWLGGNLPVDPATKALAPDQVHAYAAKVRGESDLELAAEKKRLEARRADAGTGAHQDPQVVKNVDARLAVIAAEQKLRSELEKGPQPEYALKARTMSTADLNKEVARQQERLHEATTGLDQDPALAAEAREKIAVLNTEQMRRLAASLSGGVKIPFGAVVG